MVDMVQGLGLGLRDQVSGIRVWCEGLIKTALGLFSDVGFRISGFDLWVSDFGFRV